jgi:biopolymer transport protein ExbD
MWRVSDLVEGLIFFALALMLVHTVFVTVRFSRRYARVRREPWSDAPDATRDSQRSTRNLVAELSCGVGTLQSIAFTAPLLGLAGTTYGILCLLYRGLASLKWPYAAAISLEMSTALVATAAGLMVAIPAAISYNVLCTRLQKLEGHRSSTLLEAIPRTYGFAQTLPLRRRFSDFPAFALIAAPFFAILVPMFALMLRPSISVGLPVHLLKIGVSDDESIPIVISVIGTSATGASEVYVNSTNTPWNELGNTLRIQLRVRPHWIVYIAGEDNVPWAHVATAIDVARGLHAKVVLLTAKPLIKSGNLPKLRIKNQSKK